MTTNLDNANQENYGAAVQLENCDGLVKANAGSGKTHLLVDHYFHLLARGIHPRSIVAFTFTDKAARQLKDKILFTLPHHPEFSGLPKDTLREWREQIHDAPIGTIHQFCLRILQEGSADAGPFKGTIIDPATEINLRESILNQVLQAAFEQGDGAVDCLLPSYGMPGVRNTLRYFLVKQDNFADRAENSPSLPTLAEDEEKMIQAFLLLAHEAKAKIEQVKRHHHWLSFDDLERKALENLKNPGAPLQKFLNPLLHLLIDEFQDTSPIQIAILEALREFKRQKRQPLFLFAVGDPKQSIYRFRNVDRSLIERSEKNLLKNGGKAFLLPKNYRSVPGIVDFANHFSATAFPGAAPSVAKRAAVDSRSVHIVPLEEPEGNSNRASRQTAEAQWVAQKIRSLHEAGRPWETMAVLFRASASALPLIDQLKEQGIPFTLRGGRDLFDRQEILDLKNLLYFLARPQDNLPVIGLLRSPIFLLSDATLFFLMREVPKGQSLYPYLAQHGEISEALKKNINEEASKLHWAVELLKTWTVQAPLLSPHSFLREVVHQLDLRRLYGEIGGDWEAPLAIEQFLTWLGKLESEMDRPDLASIVALLRQLAKTPTLKAPLGDLVEGGGVHLSTMHSAKGLQFPTVFLLDLARSTPAFKDPVQCQDGQWALKIPDQDGDWRETPRFTAMKENHLREEAEENKRLLYVAITRAQEELWIPLFFKVRGKTNLDALLRAHIGEDLLKKYFFSEPMLQTPKNKIKDLSLLASLPADSKVVERALPRLTVSQMESFSQCPLKYYFAYHQGYSDEAWEEPTHPSQSTLGTLLHRALHHRKLFPEKSSGQIVQFLLQTEPLWNQEKMVAQLAAYLENYLASPAFEKISEAQEDHSELPFLLKLNNGYIRGQLDRLIRWQNRWHLIDFKFSMKHLSHEQVQKDYGFQLKTYTLAARQFLQGAIPSVEVHLLEDGRTLTMNYTEVQLADHQRDMEATIGRFSETRLEAIKIHEFCYACPFNRKVPLCPVPRGHPFIP